MRFDNDKANHTPDVAKFLHSLSQNGNQQCKIQAL